MLNPRLGPDGLSVTSYKEVTRQFVTPPDDAVSINRRRDIGVAERRTTRRPCWQQRGTPSRPL
jgi:hypothetical protein